MNYLKHYERLIERAQTRSILPGEYFETHHIVPKCLGGTNDSSNLVKLFPEEHYVAHQLLVKMHPGNPKLIFALIIMTGKKKNTPRNNKVYGWLKKRLSVAKTGKKHSEESRKKMSESAKKKPPITEETRIKMSKPRLTKRLPASEETKRKISETKRLNPSTSPTKGRIMSVETKEKLRQINLGKHHTEETKKKISQNHSDTSWNKGIPLTEEHRRKLSEVGKGQIRGPMSETTKQKIFNALPFEVCPHCNKLGRGGSMRRWHFSNCRITHNLR